MYSPINEEKTKFYYNVKTYNMKVTGYLEYQDKKFPIKNFANGGRDWGRGVWNYNSFWMWATA